jgi:hypothetical protein
MLACRYVFSRAGGTNMRGVCVRVLLVLWLVRVCLLLVDLGQELVVAEKRVLVLADLDGAAAELFICQRLFIYSPFDTEPGCDIPEESTPCRQAARSVQRACPPGQRHRGQRQAPWPRSAP